MTEPKTAIEPRSLREVAFEHFEEFFESIIEQSGFTPEQQVALKDALEDGKEVPGAELVQSTRLDIR